MLRTVFRNFESLKHLYPIMSTTLDYRNKIILAPMVRIGTLPMRLLALEYGADLVYSPEIVDKKMIVSERQFDEKTGIISYLDNKNSVAFTTHPIEKSKLIFQIGTADPDLALQAALKVKQDVAGIDVNCGCPKKFSIQGGMGAALLSNPDKLKAILINLVQNCGLPVTCKIRMLSTKEKTIELCKMIESTGVKAIAIHCRTRDERPKDPGHWDIFNDIVENIKSIPIIANGDVFQRSDIIRLRELSNVSSIMIARAAEENVSIFRQEGTLPLEDVVISYIKKALEVGNSWPNTKYALMQMYAVHSKEPKYKLLVHTKSYEELCKIYGLETFFEKANLTGRLTKTGKNLNKFDGSNKLENTSNNKRKHIEYQSEVENIKIKKSKMIDEKNDQYSTINVNNIQ
ncbi:FMN-linked oxidoreductase [Gigaspora margarita]|uniref:FMN-linked oxidoreductase n=1 Tax=Gigaspora margarita TaxID=4874 RepID=A0A8H3XGK1_GIGMA|nr:FMN-linked oxidoreductase [Gigaspora margarita]